MRPPHLMMSGFDGNLHLIQTSLILWNMARPRGRTNYLQTFVIPSVSGFVDPVQGFLDLHIFNANLLTLGSAIINCG